MPQLANPKWARCESCDRNPKNTVRYPHFDWPRSGYKNRDAFESSGSEISKGLVCLGERIGRGLGDDADFRHQSQEIDSVLPREIGDRHEMPLPPKQAIGEAWDVAHMDSRTNDAAALADRL